MRGHSRFSTAAAAAAVVLSVLWPPHSAQAQPAAVAAKPPAAAEPLKVWVDARNTELDQRRLRQFLARELKRDVVIVSDAGGAAVQIRVHNGVRAQVEYTTGTGERLTREVELPPDRDRSLEVLSWLTVNLVRDEASELLDELRARRKEEAAARAAEEQAAADKAAADKAAADKAAADKAAADKAAADKAAAEQAKRKIDLKVEAPNAGLLKDPKRSFDLALATPVSLLRDSHKRELWVQLAFAYGESGGIRGVAVSPVGLRIRQDVLGHAVGAAFVLVGGNVKGTVLSAGYSQVDGNLQGVQVGAGVAIQRGKLARGVIVAAGAAVAGDMTGVLVGAGIASARSLNGVAASAGITVIRGPAEGILVGAGATFASDFKGTAVSAGVNVARDLRGIVVAPLNVQRRVSGLQLGIVNVAQEVDGAAIGIISIAKNGRLQPVLWGDSDGAMHVALKSIAGYAFTQLGGGLDLRSKKLSYDGGIGAHLRLTETIFLEPGVHYSGRQTVESTETGSGPSQHHLHYMAGAGLRLANKLDLLAAGGVRHTLEGTDVGAVTPEARFGLAFF
jgi:hypothetical protein